jgi:hypothetical protein
MRDCEICKRLRNIVFVFHVAAKRRPERFVLTAWAFDGATLHEENRSLSGAVYMGGSFDTADSDHKMCILAYIMRCVLESSKRQADKFEGFIVNLADPFAGNAHHAGDLGH